MIASRGITTSEHVQYVLVGFQMTVLLGFAVMAFVHVGRGDAPAGLSFDVDWFNPFTGLAVSAFVIGVTGSMPNTSLSATLCERSLLPTRPGGPVAHVEELPVANTASVSTTEISANAGQQASGPD